MRNLRIGLFVACALAVPVAIACSDAETVTSSSGNNSSSSSSSGESSSSSSSSSSGDNSSSSSSSSSSSGSSSSSSGSSSSSSSGSRDASMDAMKDVAVDAGPPPAPATGSACAQVGEIFTKPCGRCGEAEAICENNKKVGTYSACKQPSGVECTTGETRKNSCGNCGQEDQVCDDQCKWLTIGACTGEPAGACPANTSSKITAGCAAGQERTKSCNAQCMASLSACQCDGKPPMHACAIGSAPKVQRGTCQAGFEQLQNCNNNCQYDAAGPCRCDGKPPMHACAIGSAPKVSPGNCPAGQVQEQACNNNCQYDPPGPCKDRNKVTLGTAVNAETSALISVLATDLAPHPKVPTSGGLTCPAAALDSGTTTAAFITLVNPNNVAARVDLNLENSGDTIMGVYPGSPNPPADMKNCVGKINDECPNGPFGPSCLAGADAVTVPANGNILVYVSRWSSTNKLAFDFTFKAKIVGLP
jgi:hypothetical protein